MPIFAQMIQSIPTAGSMTGVSLAAISPVFTNALVGVFLVICIVMILLVLIQRPQGGGLSGAFGSGGGGGAGQTAFGTKTGDVLTWATIAIFVAFVGFAIILNFTTRPPKPATGVPTITAPGGAGTSNGDTQNEGQDEGQEETDDAFDLSGNPLDLIDTDNDEHADGEHADGDQSTQDQPADEQPADDQSASDQPIEDE